MGSRHHPKSTALAKDAMRTIQDFLDQLRAHGLSATTVAVSQAKGAGTAAPTNFNTCYPSVTYPQWGVLVVHGVLAPAATRNPERGDRQLRAAGPSRHFCPPGRWRCGSFRRLHSMRHRTRVCDRAYRRAWSVQNENGLSSTPGESSGSGQRPRASMHHDLHIGPPLASPT